MAEITVQGTLGKTVRMTDEDPTYILDEGRCRVEAEYIYNFLFTALQAGTFEELCKLIRERTK